MNATGPPSGPDPHATVRQLVTGYWISQSIGVAARLGVADRLADGPRGSDELSRLCGAHPRSFFRLLRALAGVGLLRQLDDDRFELTSTGQYLRSDVAGSLRRYATFFCGDRQWRAWGRLDHSVATGETAYDEVLGAGLYDHLAEDPDAAEEFNQAMASSIAQSRAAVVEGYDFSEVRTVVDVGGGDGTLLAAILAANPQTQGVLFEREAAARRAEQNLAESGLAERCRVAVGDFFEAVPGGGDAYILSRVVHVWDDERSVRLLERCRRAMGSHARLLVVERVIPPGDEPFFGKMGDLNLMVLTGGCERTEAEYRHLLERSGLELRRVVPTRSEMSVIEAVVGAGHAATPTPPPSAVPRHSP